MKKKKLRRALVWLKAELNHHSQGATQRCMELFNLSTDDLFALSRSIVKFKN